MTKRHRHRNKIPHAIKKQLTLFEKEGGIVEQVTFTNGGHIRIQFKGLGCLFLSKTTSDRRHDQNAMRDFRRLQNVHANHGSTH